MNKPKPKPKPKPKQKQKPNTKHSNSIKQYLITIPPKTTTTTKTIPPPTTTPKITSIPTTSSTKITQTTPTKITTPKAKSPSPLSSALSELPPTSEPERPPTPLPPEKTPTSTHQKTLELSTTTPSTAQSTQDSSIKKNIDTSSPNSTVIGIPSSEPPSQDEIEIIPQLISTVEIAQAHIPPPAPCHSPASSSSLSSLETVHQAKSPSAASPPTPIKPPLAFTSDDLDGLDLEDEWLTKALEPKILKKPTELAPTMATKNTPVLLPTRQSQRSIKKPPQLIGSTSSSPTIIKLRTNPSSKIPDQFSLSSILKDRQLREQRQEQLNKRKREEFSEFDTNQLPDHLNLDSILLTTPKKTKPNSRQAHDLQPQDHSKKKNSSTTRSTRLSARNLNSSCQEDPSTPPRHPHHHEYEDRNEPDLFPSPSKLALLKQDLSLLQPHQPLPSGSSTHTQRQAGSAGVQKLIEQDIETGQLAGINRGAEFRQVFRSQSPPALASSPAPCSSIVPPTVSFEHDYLGVPGVSTDPDVVDFVHELIDSLNYSAKYPEYLSIDLVNFLPSQLTHQAGSSTEEADDFRNEELKITHQTILKILSKPFIDPRFPLKLAQQSVFLVSSYVENANISSSYRNDADLTRQSYGKFWLEILQAGLIKLGVLNHLVYFGEYLAGPDEGREKEEDEPGAEMDVTTRVERCRVMVGLLTRLSAAEQLDERARRWALTVAMRLGLEPRMSFGLRPEIVGYVGEVLGRMTAAGRRAMPKDHILRLVLELLSIGAQLRTWTNALELLALIPFHFHLRKFLAIGLLDVIPRFLPHHAQPSSHQLDRLLPQIARWLTHISNRFMDPPTAREIYNAIREGAKRPYEKQEAEWGGNAEREGGAEAGAERVPSEPGQERDKFRAAFRAYLGDRVDALGAKKPRMNEAQCHDLVAVLQVALLGIWDFLIHPDHRAQVKTSGYTLPATASAADVGPAPAPASGNVWLRLVHQALSSLDREIKQITSPQFQAERIKLKNTIYRLSTALEFLNQEAFLIIKGIDSRGQFKLDKFFAKKNLRPMAA